MGRTRLCRTHTPLLERERSVKRIVFFDGICGLCDAFVRFVIKRDKERKFLFTPLQGETAKTMLPDEPLEELSSVVLLEGEQRYRKSDAAIRILAELGGAWSIVEFLRYIPRIIRDNVYRFIAQMRYRFFGRKEACTLPSTDDKSRYLP